MSVQNRELSQFGSFIKINDSTQKIGITTQLTPYVGIGLVDPQTKLHVLGDVTIDGNLYYNGQLITGNFDLYTTGIITANSFYNTLGQKVVAFDSWETSGSTIYRLNGNVGLGTSFPTQKLQVSGNVLADSYYGNGSNLTGIVTQITAGTNISLSGSASNVIISSTLSSYWLKNEVGINTTDNVGIGSTFPTSKLTVIGDASISGVLTALNFVGDLTGTATTAIDAINAAFATTSTNVIGGVGSLIDLNVSGITTLGTLQISSGVLNATSGIITYYGDGSKLEGINVGGGAGVNISTNTTNSNQYVTYATGFGTVTGLGVTTNFVFNPSKGNLGIGTNNPTSKLHVIGDTNITGVTTASRFVSTVATGTAPLTVTSTTKVTNLNADLLDGYNTGTSGFAIPLLDGTNTWGNNQTFNSQVLIGSATNTGTSSQNLQVTGGAYVSGNLGIGTTNPQVKLQVGGTIGFNDSNIKIGDSTTGGFLSSSNRDNIFMGRCAGGGNPSSGSYNIFFGFRSGYKNIGNHNTFFGYGAGCDNCNGDHNIMLGYYSGRFSSSGSTNVFLGRETGCLNESTNNVFLGHFSGNGNTNGCSNTFVGDSAGYDNALGNHNSFFGRSSGFQHNFGDYNAFFGAFSGYSIQSYSHGNTFIGYAAGCSQSSGCYNVVLGYARNTPSLSGSNQLVIGAGSTNWITGNSSYNVGIGTTNPTSKLHVIGDARVTGSIIAEAGSVSNPSIRINDTDTGFYSNAVGTILAVANGQNVVSFDSSKQYNYGSLYLTTADDANATSGNTIIDSAPIHLQGKYWNGSSSQNQTWRITNDSLSTTPTSDLAYQWASTTAGGYSDKLRLNGDGDLQIYGDLNAASSNTNINLFTTNATAINAFNAATNLIMGATTGVSTIRNASVKLTGNTASTSTTTGTLVVTGGVGVSGDLYVNDINASGITNSVSLIVANNSTGNAVRITQTGSGNALAVEDSTNPDATPFVVSAVGDVGIGTTNPSTKLHVMGGIRVVKPSDDVAFTIQSTAADEAGNFGFRLKRTTTGNTQIIHNGVSNFDIIALDDAVMTLATNATERLGIAGDGATTLKAPTFKIFNAAGTNEILQVNTTNRTVTANATIGITTNSTTDAVRINQTGSGNALVVEDSTNPDVSPFVVDSIGDVGIGTTIPATKLHIVGGGIRVVKPSDDVAFTLQSTAADESNNFGFRLKRTTSGQSEIIHNGTNAFHIVANDNADIKIFTNNTARFRVDGDGTNNSLTPIFKIFNVAETNESFQVNTTNRNAHVGIYTTGDLVLGSTLSVFQDSISTTGWTARFINRGDDFTSRGILIRCGSATSATSAIRIENSSGTTQSDVTFTSGTVTWSAFTAAHDCIIPSYSPEITYGTLLTINEIFYKKNDDETETERGILYNVGISTAPYAKNIIGAYSQMYSEDRMVETEMLHQVLVLGDGHIRCCGEKGNIKVGDGITSSSREGIGMKMDKIGMIIGIAQEDVTFDGNEVKLVPVQYGLQQYIPDNIAEYLENLMSN